MIFENKDLEQEFLARKEEIERIINAPIDDTKYQWDNTVRRYATTIEQLKKLLNTEEFKPNVAKNIVRNINTFLQRCSSPEYHIALVGAIKAGKSTLINALIGYELASTQVTPETASLTKFKSAKEDFVEVSFYSQEEWAELWKSVTKSNAEVFMEEYKNLNADAEKNNWLGKPTQHFTCNDRDELKTEIAKWTSSKSSTHYFVKEVTVGLKDFDLPNGVVLVDTPGLDDVVEYRSNITREYIDRANAVLMCVRSDALTGGEYQTISRVFVNARNNINKIYVVGTQIDTLNRPVDDWQKQKDEWIKYLKTDKFYRNKALAEQKVMSVSAYLYTLLNQYKDNEFTETDDKYYDLNSIILKFRIRDINEHYEELKTITNIDQLKDKLQREIIVQYKEQMIQDIISSYNACRDELKENLSKIQAEQEEIIHTSKQNIEEIKRKAAEYEAKVNEAAAEKKEINDMVKQLRIETSKRVDALTHAIRNLNRR